MNAGMKTHVEIKASSLRAHFNAFRRLFISFAWGPFPVVDVDVPAAGDEPVHLARHRLQLLPSLSLQDT